MSKIELDKYYTPVDLAKYCVDKTSEIIGIENISEYLEPSAGRGVFLPLLNKKWIAMDIEPEEDSSIIRQDYLTSQIDYVKGRCIIGNPPYGKGNYTSVKFYKKAITEGDYISFILPISQLNNNLYMYEFDLIYSEDLGVKIYSGVKVHCVLNIFKRNPKGLNTRPIYELRDVSLKGVAKGKSRNDKIPDIYDFSICGFGSSCGKIAEYEYQYCQQIYITINKENIKNKVESIIKLTDWKKEYGMTATPKIKHWMIIKKLKEEIPYIE